MNESREGFCRSGRGRPFTEQGPKTEKAQEARSEHHQAEHTDLGVILHVYILPVLPVASTQEVTEEERPLGDDVVNIHVVVLLHLLGQQGLEPVSVLVVHKAILEHPTALVVPQAQ